MRAAAPPSGCDWLNNVLSVPGALCPVPLVAGQGLRTRAWVDPGLCCLPVVTLRKAVDCLPWLPHIQVRTATVFPSQEERTELTRDFQGGLRAHAEHTHAPPQLWVGAGSDSRARGNKPSAWRHLQVLGRVPPGLGSPDLFWRLEEAFLPNLFLISPLSCELLV